MAIYGYTKNYKLIKPQFDTDTWHDYMYDNLDTIDAVLSAIFASGDWQGFWKSNTHYNVGGVVIDRDTDTMYKVMVEHTTSEATFAEEFAAHPTYYELWSPNNLAEDWAIKIDGEVSNVDYSSKAYAISTNLIDSGSAQEWAIKSGAIGTTGEYSAKKYAIDAHNDYISMTTDANVVAVGTNIASLNTVSTSISGVNTTASNISSVNTVAGDINRVNLVADDIASVHTVAVDISNVINVAANKTNIDTVAGISADVSATATVATSIPTVANNDANITTVATNISDVNTAATNMAAIQAAPTAASNAANSAIDSANSANASATSANNSHIWAEGTDEQVQALGGAHSSKVWAEQSTNANIDLSNLTATGEAHFANPALTNLSEGLKNTICTKAAGTTSTASSARPAVVVKNYRNGEDWYRVWSDGWIEQGGAKTNTASGGATSYGVSLIHPFTTANYTVMRAPVWGAGWGQANADGYTTGILSRTTTYFEVATHASSMVSKIMWYACGY